MTRHRGPGRSALVLGLALFSLAFAPPAAAQSVADFYRGRTVTISVGLSAGGGFDLHARVLARFLGKHLPGAPAVVVKNAPGAGGLTLVNALYSTLPRDGRAPDRTQDRARAIALIRLARQRREQPQSDVF